MRTFRRDLPSAKSFKKWIFSDPISFFSSYVGVADFDETTGFCWNDASNLKFRKRCIFGGCFDDHRTKEMNTVEEWWESSNNWNWESSWHFNSSRTIRFNEVCDVVSRAHGDTFYALAQVLFNYLNFIQQMWFWMGIPRQNLCYIFLNISIAPDIPVNWSHLKTTAELISK